jgi:hypothetical protein
MSSPAFHVLQESDQVPKRRLVALLVAALICGGLAVLAAARLGHRVVRSRPPGRAPVQLSGVEQSAVETTARGLSLRSQQRKRLEELGWVDRDAGVARIPIERAIDLQLGRGE